MLDLRKRYQTDLKAEEEGVWVPLEDNGRIKVARQGNKRHAQFLTEAMAPYRSILGVPGAKLSDELATKISIEAMAKTILLDWDGIAQDGQELPYSVEAAISILTDAPEFREIVFKASNTFETFRLERLAADRGN